MDRPVDRHLRPHHQAELVRDARHVLIVRIMREPHEVAAELLRPAKQQPRVLLGMRAPAAQRILLVQRDSAQKYRLAVEQDVRASHGDAAKANALPDPIVVGRELDIVETRIARRPHLEGARCDVERRDATRVAQRANANAGLGNRQRHAHTRRLRTVELDARDDSVARTRRQLHGIVANIGRRRLDDRHVARQATVVPPIGVDRRYALDPARVVDLDHERVAACGEHAGHLELERREAADVATELAAVQIHVRLVVGRPEVHEHPPPGGRCVVELAAIPDRALVVVEPLVLRVPVARDGERRARIEVVLDELRSIGWLAVEEVSAARLGAASNGSRR